MQLLQGLDQILLIRGHICQCLWFVRLRSGCRSRCLICRGLGLGGSLGLGVLLQREIWIHNLRLLLLLLAELTLMLAVLPLLWHLVSSTLRAKPRFCLLTIWPAELV